MKKYFGRFGFGNCILFIILKILHHPDHAWSMLSSINQGRLLILAAIVIHVFFPPQCKFSCGNLCCNDMKIFPLHYSTVKQTRWFATPKTPLVEQISLFLCTAPTPSYFLRLTFSPLLPFYCSSVTKVQNDIESGPNRSACPKISAGNGCRDREEKL